VLVIASHFFLIDYFESVLLSLLFDEVNVPEGALAELFLADVFTEEGGFGFQLF